MVVLGFVVFALGSGLGEETILRGTLWEGLGGLGPWSRSITTALAFGAVHLLGLASSVPLTVILAQTVFATGFGLVLAGVRLRAGSIWTVVFLHAVFNFGALWAGGGVSRTFVSGAEAGLLFTGGVMALWGGAVIYWWVRASGAESKNDGSRIAEASGPGKTPVRAGLKS
jgi:membrane protease YdiL (CAAX protease family)